jgi:hypothetical protein
MPLSYRKAYDYACSLTSKYLKKIHRYTSISPAPITKGCFRARPCATYLTVGLWPPFVAVSGRSDNSFSVTRPLRSCPPSVRCHRSSPAERERDRELTHGRETRRPRSTARRENTPNYGCSKPNREEKQVTRRRRAAHHENMHARTRYYTVTSRRLLRHRWARPRPGADRAGAQSLRGRITNPKPSVD